MAEAIDFDAEFDASELEAIIDKVQNLNHVLERMMRRIAIGLEAQVKRNLSGPILRVQTGRLRSSITHQVRMTGDEVIAEVGSNVIYLPAHEFGAVITPKSAQYLVIPQDDGSFRKVSQVVIPERKPLRTSWEQFQPSALEDLMNTLRRELHAV